MTYQARNYLRACLESLAANTRAAELFPDAGPDSQSFEVIVVDNGSSDGTVEMLQQDFPTVRLIQNDRNEGYTRPMNQALRAARGRRYLLQLNPDTLVLPQALNRLVDFMEQHPQVGVCGPKVLNQDRSLQKSCRRGESRPWAVFTYFSGLAALFPKSKTFTQYQLSYLDEDQTQPVAGVAGSCMLMRRATVDQIGYLDEIYFAYQEDADFCFRARQAGWQVCYMPEAQIIHYGGVGGSQVQPYRTIYEWHRSYYNYYRKNLSKDYFFLFNWFYYLAMLIKFGLTLARNFVRAALRRGPTRASAVEKSQV